MLEAKKNRLDYGNQLKPPVGYTLDYAITTTYSLDLEAILLVPVALFFSENLDFNPKDVRDDMLEALTNVSKHITIYCQRGKIKAPNTYNHLMAYWEKSIHQIQLPRFNQSFHPKVWIIRYISEEKRLPTRYRLINTSRNMTFSRDWDMAITVDGKIEKREGELNIELIHMLRYLNKNGRKKVPNKFFEELPFVMFDTPRNFDSLHFHPIGIPNPDTGSEYQNPIINTIQKLDFRLAMSPFLDTVTIKKLHENAKELVLFSSEFELSGIPEKSLNLANRKYMFSPFIEEAEKMDSLSEPDVEPLNQNLHAKFYIDKKGGDYSWFIGSANATDPANGRNIEFMVELKSKKYAVNPRKMEEQLIGKDNTNITLFEPFEGTERAQIEEERKKEHEIRKLIHSLSGLFISGEAILDTDDHYRLIIKIPETNIIVPKDFSVRVKPLPERAKASIKIDLSKKTTIDEFKGFEETALSPFLLFEIWHAGKLEKRFVLDMKIELGDDRFKKIFSSIINNRSRFLSYLSFLLSEETTGIEIENESNNNKKNKLGNGNGIAFFEGTPVYEKLLLVASRNPSRLKRIDGLIDRLKGEQEIDGKEIISKEFEKMWEVFSQLLKGKK
jgi:hypothetical protein